MSSSGSVGGCPRLEVLNARRFLALRQGMSAKSGDPSGREARFKASDALFPGKFIELKGQSADGSRLVARASAPDKPAIYYLIDYSTHKASILGEEYPTLADATLGKVSAITYKARDGTE